MDVLEPKAFEMAAIQNPYKLRPGTATISSIDNSPRVFSCFREPPRVHAAEHYFKRQLSSSTVYSEARTCGTV